ncbi:MAG: DUF2490 domain-containing protein, partial [Candidatus Tantalella remota]|nr:DUF2490 domain-containing protein [Candidatus Tantalella remota]
AFAFQYGDFQIWNTDKVDAKINDRLKFKAEQELRFGNNVSEFYYTHTDGGFAFKAADALYFGVNYRLIYEKNSNGKWKLENRPHVNATLKWKLYGFKFSDRNRMELRIRDGKDDVWRYRNELTVKYPWKWTKMEIQPYTADEIFVDLHSGNLSRNRIYNGFTFKLFEHLKGDLFYLWQISRSDKAKWTAYNVLGIELKVVF